MHKLIVSIIRHEKIDDVISALKKEQVAFTYSNVKGFCSEVHLYHEDIHERIKVEVIAQEHDVERVKTLVMSNACCGLEGDGCLAVYILDEYITFNSQ